MTKKSIHQCLCLPRRKGFVGLFVLFLVVFTVMNSFANELWTFDEALRPVAVYDPVDKKVVLAELQYDVTADTESGDTVFMTVHSGVVNIVRIFLKTGQQLRLVRSFRSAYSAMDKPVSFSFIPSGESKPVQLISISEVSHGTGAYTTEHVYEFYPGQNSPLQEVRVVSPAETYKSRLEDGEDVRQGVRSRFSKAGLYFEFYIWKQDDANCCPSAGKVNGTYKLVREENNPNSLVLVAHSFQRGSILPYDYKTLD